ncbi:MAG TPA: Gfo/Idh/MocA family oxidoreductase [Mycobacteriales bacterium]|nr:Gfo/Idh/MocA family oxidoreductase [Mycobacteriales bacterium]
MRIGIVGTENSHADHFVRYFNEQGRYGDHRVVALSGGDSERNRKLAAAGGITDLVESAPDLIGRVDAAIVCSRDGRQHRAEATALLDAGLPVLVDKPLACDIPDAQAILDSAHRSGVPVSSYSALRWAPPVTELAAKLSDPPDLVAITGPADPTSEYGGIFFYGIHIVEIALSLAPGRPVEDVTTTAFEDTVVVTARAGSTRLLLEMVRPNSRTRLPWRLVASGSSGSIVEELQLGADYALPGVEVFVEMLRTERNPLSDAELLAPVALLSAISEGLAK